MSRSRMLLRQSRRALALGAGLSVLAHVAVFALVRMEFEPLPSTQRTIVFAPADAPAPREPEDATEVVKLRPVEVLPSLALAGAAPSGAAAAPAPAAAAPSIATAPVVTGPELTYDQLVVLDPVRSTAVTPVAFGALTVAETTAPAEEKAEVPVYVPGSIGKAKRGWASSGEAEGRTGEGAGWTFGVVAGNGDGHCPMPGRGRPIPPTRGPEGTILR